MRDELPHSIAVVVEEMGLREGRPDDKPLLDVYANIFLERDSQKGIVIGHKGARLREVGATARRQIEALLGTPVYLDLHVKIAKDWQTRPQAAAQAGLLSDPAEPGLRRPDRPTLDLRRGPRQRALLPEGRRAVPGASGRPDRPGLVRRRGTPRRGHYGRPGSPGPADPGHLQGGPRSSTWSSYVAPAGTGRRVRRSRRTHAGRRTGDDGPGSADRPRPVPLAHDRTGPLPGCPP